MDKSNPGIHAEEIRVSINIRDSFLILILGFPNSVIDRFLIQHEEMNVSPHRIIQLCRMNTQRRFIRRHQCRNQNCLSIRILILGFHRGDILTHHRCQERIIQKQTSQVILIIDQLQGRLITILQHSHDRFFKLRIRRKYNLLHDSFEAHLWGHRRNSCVEKKVHFIRLNGFFDAILNQSINRGAIDEIVVIGNECLKGLCGSRDDCLTISGDCLCQIQVIQDESYISCSTIKRINLDLRI